MENTYQLINEFRQEMNQRFDKMEEKFITEARFKPVEAITYGMVSLILVAFAGAIIALVIKDNPAAASAIEAVTPTVFQTIK